MANTSNVKSDLRRTGKGSPIVSSAPKDEKYLFGTEAEIQGRDATGYDGKNPELDPPHHEQIGPKVTSLDLNNPQADHRSGNMKFSRGI